MLCFVRRRRVSDGTLWLPRQLLMRMRDQARASSPDETGGMLLGWEGRGHLAVHSLIGPGPGARSSRSRFEPDGEWQLQRVADAYRASGRTVTYLGDWHSHPNGRGEPSARDTATAAAVSRHRAARAPEPVTLILCRERRQWRPCAFRYRGGRLRPLEIEIVDAL